MMMHIGHNIALSFIIIRVVQLREILGDGGVRKWKVPSLGCGPGEDHLSVFKV